MKSRLADHAMAKLPSIFTTSLFRIISTSSSFGQSASTQNLPWPFKLRLNRPSPPAIAEEKLLRITALCFNEDSQAKNRPSSRTTLPPQSAASIKIKCLYVGSKTKRPSPVYSGLIADSPVTLPRTALLNRSPAPLIPVVAFTLPSIHCIAPA